MKQFAHIKAKGKPDYTTLTDHLDHVVAATVKAAEAFGLDTTIARQGAVLHDIGKAHPVFQARLKDIYQRSPVDEPMRHELASLLFLPLFDQSLWPTLVEMVVAHHKSARNDEKGLGIVDLDERFGPRAFKLHSAEWEEWSPTALAILQAYGMPSRPISLDEANAAYRYAFNYCENVPDGFSEWKGLLMAGDHFASALVQKTTTQTQRLFRTPVLTYYNRQHDLYPLSTTASDSERSHTLVTACTGAGKTDFLLRRCRGRVFYTLPFQASINSMFERIKSDLADKNPDLDIRVLHAASRLMVEKNKYEEKTIQGHMGSAVKVLTPHQLASVVFGTRGYEATLMDLRGCDVILDEIHCYTKVTRSIVLKIVEMLKLLGCRVHIGTATMPTVMMTRIRDLLGPETVYEITLTDEQLNAFNRHTVHKLNTYADAQEPIRKALSSGQKVLVVANRVEIAQQRFQELQEVYPDIPILLLHSRFKRGERGKLEQQLTGKRIDTSGRSIHEFNTGEGPCIVVSTQVVEVSLDISFDLMVTDTAPLDALIQRFGRVNRKRTPVTIGTFKPVFIIAPPETEGDAKPYELDILRASFDVLPDNAVLHERDVQRLIDQVFPSVDDIRIDKDAIYVNGHWRIEKLVHKPKSVLFDALEIDSMICVTETDQQAYEQAGYEERMQYEIPVRYHAIAHNGLARSEYGNKPFIVPDKAYNSALGLQMALARHDYYDAFI